jgi:hypothetical protein
MRLRFLVRRGCGYSHAFQSALERDTAVARLENA